MIQKENVDHFVTTREIINKDVLVGAATTNERCRQKLHQDGDLNKNNFIPR